MAVFGEKQNAIFFQIGHILFFPIIDDYNSDVIVCQSFKIWPNICLKHILAGLTIIGPNINERFIVVCYHFLYLGLVAFRNFTLT